MKQSLPCPLRVSRANWSGLKDVWTLLSLVDATIGPFWISEALGALQKSRERSRKKRTDGYQSEFHSIHVEQDGTHNQLCQQKVKK